MGEHSGETSDHGCRFIPEVVGDDARRFVNDDEGIPILCPICHAGESHP